MAEKSGFFNSDQGDRTYAADFFAEYFASFIGNGVYPNPSTACQVIASGNMTVALSAGQGWINGYYYHNTDNLILNLDIADGVLKRIDRIVLRYTVLNREIKAYVKKGTFASTPVAPALQRDADVWELGVADIFIGNGVVSVSQANITDLRLNNTYCGIVHGTVVQVDTTTIFNQFQAWYLETIDDATTDIAALLSAFQNSFNVWFATVQDILDENTAGNLLNMINGLITRMNAAENAISNLKKFQTAGGTGTAITLTGVELVDGFQTTFVILASNSGAATTINAKPLYKPGTTTAPKLISGKAATVWYNLAGGCFFIKASAEGTAVAGDVLAGKTFSNDDDVGLTGSMANRGAVTITPSAVQQAIAAGYHNGGGYVAGDADLVAGNIKKGVNIFGVDGTVNVAPYSFDIYTGLNNISGGGITNAVVSADRIFYTTGVASTTLNICNVNGSIINSVALNANQYETIVGFDRYANHIVTKRTNGGSPYLNRYTTAGVFVNTYGPLNTLAAFEFTENYGFNIYYTGSSYYPTVWDKVGNLIRSSTDYLIGSTESIYTSIIGIGSDIALYIAANKVLKITASSGVVVPRLIQSNQLGAFLQPK